MFNNTYYNMCQAITKNKAVQNLKYISIHDSQVINAKNKNLCIKILFRINIFLRVPWILLMVGIYNTQLYKDHRSIRFRLNLQSTYNVIADRILNIYIITLGTWFDYRTISACVAHKPLWWFITIWFNYNLQIHPIHFT